LRNNKKNAQPVTVPGCKVEVKEGRFNDALRKFKKRVQDDGRLQTIKERAEYTKPSVARARAKAAARARWLKKVEKDNQLENRNPWA
jgi:small subunit ribosomal protein S21